MRPKAKKIPPDTFAARLFEVMRTAEPPLTQVDLARLSGVTQATISYWLTHSEKPPSRRRIQPLAVRLELSEDWLLSGVGVKELPSDKRERRESERTEHRVVVQKVLGEEEDPRRKVVVSDLQRGMVKTFLFDAATEDQWELILAQIETSFYTITRTASRTHPMS